MTIYPLEKYSSLGPIASARRTKRLCFMRAALGMVLATWLGACSSNLVVTEQFPTGSDAHGGLPIHTRVPAIEFFVHTAHSKVDDCRPRVKARRATMVSEDAQYVNVKSRSFATASLTVKYGTDGAVKEIAFGSEPSGEAIEAATAAMSTLLPFVGITPESGPDTEEEEKALADSPPLCDSSELSLDTMPAVELDARMILNRVSDLQVQVDEIQAD